MSNVQCREVDRVEVTVLVDNYTDLFLLVSEGVMQRPPMPTEVTPLAEHGLSLLVKVYANGEEHHLLMDTSLTPEVLMKNMEVYQVNLDRIEGVFLSHGHLDHFGGLMGLLERAPRGTALILHPDAFLPRRLNIPGAESPIEMPSLDENVLQDLGVRIVKIREPSLCCADTILALGEVERVTDFETGFPWAEIQKDDAWSVDPFKDDQGLAVKVKGKGLVVIGGCSHAGIVNTVQHAKKVTDTEEVHAVLGGFHLTGPIFEPLIEPTVEAMVKIDPDYIMPMHCTGWKAINAFSEAMQDKFFLTSVGTTYVFE